MKILSDGSAGSGRNTPANRRRNVTVVSLVETPPTLTRSVAAPAMDQLSVDGIYATGFTLRPPLESGLMSRAKGEPRPRPVGLLARTPIRLNRAGPRRNVTGSIRRFGRTPPYRSPFRPQWAASLNERSDGCWERKRLMLLDQRPLERSRFCSAPPKGAALRPGQVRNKRQNHDTSMALNRSGPARSVRCYCGWTIGPDICGRISGVI
jgi:hypothetical protein